ncbi:MAG: hypothetical protein CL678_02490 [Bdellovibrionaceae bacterium]|nr:hypothetical protein [Pseudobdellovibrionaceae bacterium]
MIFRKKKKVNEGKFLIPGFELAYLNWGKLNNPPLLLLHGWLDNAGAFEKLGPLLGKQFNVFALEFSGHGKSSWIPEGMAYHFIDYVYDLAAVIQKQQWGPLPIVGHSMGSAIAGLLSSSHPGFISKLVFLDGMGALSGDEKDCVEQLSRFIERRLHPSSSRKIYASIEDAAKARMKTGEIPFDVALGIAHRGTVSEDDGVRWAFDPALTTPSAYRFTENMVKNFLKSMNIPVLLIEGTQGYSHYRSLFSQRKKEIIDLRTEVFSGSHYVHEEHANEVAEKIVKFLTE